jgi:hypothetical protein
MEANNPDIPENTHFPEDDYDKIIIKHILEVAVEFFNSKPEVPSISPFVFGLNEIARLVKDDMSYITAQKHINKLIEENYLIDLNETIEEILNPDNLAIELSDEIEDFFAIEIITPLLEKIIKKIEKSKKRLMLNFTKLGLEEWFTSKIPS